MKSAWREQFRPQIAALLAAIPAGTAEKEVRRQLRGLGKSGSSHLYQMWCKELNAQLDVRFDRARFKNLGPAPTTDPDQLPLL